MLPLTRGEPHVRHVCARAPNAPRAWHIWLPLAARGFQGVLPCGGRRDFSNPGTGRAAEQVKGEANAVCLPACLLACLLHMHGRLSVKRIWTGCVIDRPRPLFPPPPPLRTPTPPSHPHPSPQCLKECWHLHRLTVIQELFCCLSPKAGAYPE